MSVTWMPGRGPKSRKLAAERLDYLLYKANREEDEAFLDSARHEIPDAWHTLEMDVPCEAPKTKVTLYLDDAVIRMFRRMGRGYHARINRILETWLQMKMAEKSVFMREVRDQLIEAMDESMRPDVGDEMMRVYQQLWDGWGQEGREKR